MSIIHVRTVREPVAIRKTVHGVAVLDWPAITAPLPTIEYLVREIGLAAGSGAPHLVAGYGFSGKTLATQAMALALAAGRSVWGAFHPTKSRRVVHVDLEQGDYVTRRRYQRLAKAMGLEKLTADALLVAVLPPLSLSKEHSERWRALMQGRDLIIVDSLRAATSGVDENDSAIRGGLDLLGNLSESTGCRAFVIHHARKPAQDGGAGAGRYSIRGSSAIFDACDGVYVFGAAKGEPIRVEHVKARSHGDLVSDLALVISDVDVGGDPQAGLRVQVHGVELIIEQHEKKQEAARKETVDRHADAIRRALAQKPGLGRYELRETVGLSGSRLAEVLSHMGPEIEVQEEKQGRTTILRHFLKKAADPTP